MRGQGKLVGLATRTPESAKRHSDAFGVPGFTDYRAMIDELKPDAVSVVTPDHLHCEVTCCALSAGLHVLLGSGEHRHELTQWFARLEVRQSLRVIIASGHSLADHQVNPTVSHPRLDALGLGRQ